MFSKQIVYFPFIAKVLPSNKLHFNLFAFGWIGRIFLLFCCKLLWLILVFSIKVVVRIRRIHVFPHLKWCKYPMDERERERHMISSVCTSTRVKSMNFCTHKISYYILASLQFRFIKLDLKMFSIRILRMSSFTLSVTHAHSNSLMCYIVCGVRCVCAWVLCHVKFIEYKLAR